MAESTTPDAQPLQFDQVEPARQGETAEGLSCKICSTPLVGHYYEANGQPVCEHCRYSVEQSFAARGGTGAFFKAALYGLGGGLVGAAAYYAVLALFNLEVGLLSILVGWLAGTGVAKGSGHKGGWLYQTLAVGITYFCIVSTYVPLIIQEFQKMDESGQAAAAAPAPKGSGPGAAATPAPASTAQASAVTAQPKAGQAAPGASPPADGQLTFGNVVLAIAGLFLIAAIAPFLQGASSILGLLIIFFGLLQAWRLNRKATLSIEGPFRIGSTREVNPATAADAQ